MIFNNFIRHKQIVCLSLIFFLSLLFIPVYADDIEYIEETFSYDSIETSTISEQPLSLNARACIVLDRNSQRILYGKNENSKVKMASTTKILTGILIIENCNLADTVEVSKKAANTGGSRLGLKSGDKITIHDLLYGLLLCSGNDAAVALAETASGSVSEFAVLMNNKVKELGLANSHFESPHGLDSENHYTTAYELSLLANYAMKNESFAKIVGTKTYTITINGYPKTLLNTNELLGNLNGVYGIKTGFTNGANRCLVTCCKRGNLDLICVVLGCDTKKFRTQDSIKLIEYTFSNFEPVNIQELAINEFNSWEKENSNSFSVTKGVNNNVSVYLKDLTNATIPINKNDISNIKIFIDCNKILTAPINSDTCIGKLYITLNNEILDEADICTSSNIDKKDFSNYFYDFFSTGIDNFFINSFI